jgi:hypothetical protein
VIIVAALKKTNTHLKVMKTKMHKFWDGCCCHFWRYLQTQRHLPPSGKQPTSNKSFRRLHGGLVCINLDTDLLYALLVIAGV